MHKKGITLGLLTFGLACLVFLKPFRFFDNIFYDLNFLLSSADSADSVVVIGIDRKSIKELGAMPWPRSQMASLVEKISSGNPRVIALDFFFPKRSDQRENDSLAAVFSRTRKLVLPFRAAGITDKGSINQAIPNDIQQFRFLRFDNPEKLENISFYYATDIDAADTMFSRYAQYGGFLNVSTSSSSQKIREAIQVIKIGDEYFPSFAVAAVAAYYNLTPGDIILDGRGEIDLKYRTVPITSYAATSFINFRNKSKPINEISAVDLLQGNVDPSVLKDKLVLVGVTDPLAGADFFITPVTSQFPGVSVWATIALDMLQKSWVRIQDPVFSLLNWFFVFLLFPGLAIILHQNRRILSLSLSIAIVTSSIVIGMVLFRYGHIFWESSSHVYAWIFSLVWLAAVKANPSLAGPPQIRLEPAENVGEALIPPPSDDELSTELPDTETTVFVTKALTSGGEDNEPVTEQPLTLSGTIIEEKACNLQGKPRTTSADAAIKERIRELAGGTIIRPLGSGGMADVYLVWNPRLEVYRAVKVIKPDQPSSYLTRFETEVRIFSKLDHPNIVHCYTVGEWHSLPFLEMEYIHGASLEEVLRKCSLLTVEQALAIGILVSRALHYAHNQVITIYGKTYKGVVHRDLKPANIMISHSGRIKLTDFGIARPGTVSLHTMDTGSIVGTLPYLAPEQLDGGELTGRADVYALGATLYEFITGERTFPQTEIPALLNAKSRGTYKPLNSSIKVADEVVAVLDKALAIDPAMRFHSAFAFGTELEKVLYKLSGHDGYQHLAMLVNRIWNS